MAGYVVRYGDSLLYQSGNDDRPIHGAKLGMKANGVSTLSFVMPPTHPMYSSISLHDFDNLVRVWFDDQLLFTGFVVRTSVDMNLEKHVACESELALLSWVHTRLTDHPAVSSNRALTGRNLFLKLIQNYNVHAEVLNLPRFSIRHNIGPDDIGFYDETIDRTIVSVNNTTPSTVLDILNNSIIDPYDCLLRIWYPDDDSGTRYIGLYIGAWSTSAQTIEFGENMTSLSYDIGDDDMYTGCMPIGGTAKKYETTNRKTIYLARNCSLGDSTIYLRTNSGTQVIKNNDVIVIGGIGFNVWYASAKQKTITSDSAGVAVRISPNMQREFKAGRSVWYLGSNPEYTDSICDLTRLDDGQYSFGGREYRKVGALVYDFELAHRYGLKTFTISDSDIVHPPTLLRKAVAELRQKTSPTVTLLVDAVDMALYMRGYRHLVAGQWVNVHSGPHGISTTMRVTSADLDMDNPSATKYTLGAVPVSMTKHMKKANREASDTRDELMYELNNTITYQTIMRLQ